MTKTRPSPLDDDRSAFRRAMADVRPLPSRPSPSPRLPPQAAARLPRTARHDVLHESLHPTARPATSEAHDEMAFRRPQLREDAWRRLRRGKFAVEAEIDLHGLRSHAAHDALRQFLGECVRQELRCVRVIHGKGLRSGTGGAVLKHAVSLWLRSLENVEACASAQPAHGGGGAVYVLLKSRR